MRVKVLHESEMFDTPSDEYYETVADDASLQEIWDHCVNGGSVTTELTDNKYVEVSEEGHIHWDDDDPNQTGCQITITWDLREAKHEC